MDRHRDHLNGLPTTSQRQWVVVVLTCTVLLFVLAAIYLLERSREYRLRVEQSSHRLALAREILARDLDRVRADLLFMAALPEIEQADAVSPETLQAATRVFTEFVSRQDVYSQVRLIDREGQEVVRVEWDGEESVAVADQDLQDKSDRYYVSESLALRGGEIFTSEFDLNLEKGEIERPLKPVIRFVTPVLNEGQPGYLLVFNYKGSSLLRELADISLPGSTYLIRSDGEFLLGPERDSEWGWVLGHNRRFSYVYPGLSPADLFESAGPVSGEHGLFAVSAAQSEQEPAVSMLQRLYFVSHVTPAEAFRSANQLLYRLILVGVLMLIPLVVITRFWAAAMDRRQWQNRKIAESEKRLRQLSAALVGLQEDERRNLSREIHDSLGQQATAINLDLRMLQANPGDSSALSRLIRESDELLKSLHGFATRVRPAELDDLGLEVALESHITAFESRTGIECMFSRPVSLPVIDPAVAAQLFRIVQESLNNIAKHAEADVAQVELDYDDRSKELILIVSDDGIGIDSVSAPVGSTLSADGRLGMLGIRERAGLLNGVVEIDSPSGGGTRIKVSVPVSSTDRSQSGGPQ